MFPQGRWLERAVRVYLHPMTMARKARTRLPMAVLLLAALSHAPAWAAASEGHRSSIDPSPDSTVVVWAPTIQGTSGGLVGVTIRIDHSEVGTSLGLVRARVSYDGALLMYESWEGGSMLGDVTLDLAGAGTGTLVFELENEDSTVNRDPGGLLQLTFRAVGSTGTLSSIELDLLALESTDGADLRPLADVRNGSVRIN